MKFFWNSDEKGKSERKRESEEKDELEKTDNSEEEMKLENEPGQAEEIKSDKVDKPVEEKVEKEENGEELESETAEQEEADKNDDSKNDENKLEKILRNIEDIDGKVEVLNDLFLKKIQSIEFEKKTTDRLYKELQEYKNDMYFQLIKPVVMSLVSLRESMKKNLKSFGVMSEEEKSEILQSYIEEVEIILENNDIEIYETNIENDSYVDVKKQKIIKKIETPYEQLHGKIENVLSSGYKYKDKIISPEKIEVNIYKKPERRFEGRIKCQNMYSELIWEQLIRV